MAVKNNLSEDELSLQRDECDKYGHNLLMIAALSNNSAIFQAAYNLLPLAQRTKQLQHSTLAGHSFRDLLKTTHPHMQRTVNHYLKACGIPILSIKSFPAITKPIIFSRQEKAAAGPCLEQPVDYCDNYPVHCGTIPSCS